MIKLITAVSYNGIIGKDGKIPWVFGPDLKLFKELTIGGSLIMGRKTWESLGSVPLKGRRNIIISQTPSYKFKMGYDLIAPNIEYALSWAKYWSDDVWVIGGAGIYSSFLSNQLIDECYITYVHKYIEPGNETTRFPFDEFEKTKWKENYLHSMIDYDEKVEGICKVYSKIS